MNITKHTHAVEFFRWFHTYKMKEHAIAFYELRSILSHSLTFHVLCFSRSMIFFLLFNFYRIDLQSVYLDKYRRFVYVVAWADTRLF